MTDLGLTLARVAKVLERASVRYMVIGGFANLVWGEPRTTMDLDVTVEVASGGLDAFATLVMELGTPLPKDPVPFAERTRVLPVRTGEGVVVDFVLATLPFELEAIRRGRRIAIAGTEVVICRPEDLIIHKVVSERAKDYEDIVGVLRRQAGRLDLETLDRQARELADGLDEPEIADRWRRARRDAGLGD